MSTMKEVASRAGVSVASVSRYINKKGYVKDDTAKKISKAIQELNYIPNEVARSLFQKKSKIVGLVLPDIANPYFAYLSRSIEETLIKNGYMMLLANTSDSEKRLSNYISTFIQNNITGIITALPIQSQSGLSIIGIDRVYEGNYIKILPDDYLGGSLTGNEILRTQFNRILIVTGNLSLSGPRKRLQGVIDKLEKKTKNYEVYELNSFNVSELDSFSEVIFKKFSSFDTVIASNDYLALKIIQSAQKNGIKVPDDLQIIGYDGISFSEMTVPQLTTIQQPINTIGSIAATRMINVLHGEENKKMEEILPVYLKKGNSLR